MNKSICCFFFAACCSSAQVHVSRMIHLLLFSTCLMLSWVKQSPLWAAETSLSPESGAARAPPAASTWANDRAASEQHPTTWGELFSPYFSPSVLLRRGEWERWAPGFQPRLNLHITSAGSRPVFSPASRLGRSQDMGKYSQAGRYHPSLNFLPFITRPKQIQPHFLTAGHKNVREIFLPKLPSHKRWELWQKSFAFDNITTALSRSFGPTCLPSLCWQSPWSHAIVAAQPFHSHCGAWRASAWSHRSRAHHQTSFLFSC